MEKQRQQQVEEAARKRAAIVVSKEQQERIQKREADLLKQKENLARQRAEAKQVKDVMSVGADVSCVKGKVVESKLHTKTAAAEQKERGKFDPSKGDRSGDVHTMGGRLPLAQGGTSMRTQPSWRQGV